MLESQESLADDDGSYVGFEKDNEVEVKGGRGVAPTGTGGHVPCPSLCKKASKTASVSVQAIFNK